MNEGRPEMLANEENEKERAFERMYQDAQLQKGNIVEFEGEYPKEEFLAYLVKQHDVVLHGSNNQGVIEFEPRQANDADKKSGNHVGVYGTQDPVLPMFYAIKDTEKFRGVAISGYQTKKDAYGNTSKEYTFQIESDMMEIQPWSEGMVYVLPKGTFEQGADDEGNPINEFMSREPVRPIVKLKIKPEEFPYINQINVIEK